MSIVTYFAYLILARKLKIKLRNVKIGHKSFAKGFRTTTTTITAIRTGSLIDLIMGSDDLLKIFSN